jgi:uncharacterized protein YeaO (DUF488 family)
MKLSIKRVYDPPAKADGVRILVDRVWPRGVSKDNAKIHAWLKNAAPSTELRKWFGHDPERWTEFRKRYRAELKENPEAVRELRNAIGKESATLVYGAKDTEHNQAVVLQELLMRKTPQQSAKKI